MNSDQITSLIRSVLQWIGPLLVAKGVISSADLPGFVTALLSLVGALMTLGPMIWGIWAHSHTNKIAQVNAIPGVKVVSASTAGAQVNLAPAVK